MDEMNQKQQDFYQKLRIKIANYLSKNKFEFADVLLLGPDFFHLLVKLTLDPRVEPASKTKFAFAVAYFFSPLDLFPEMIFGPLGYLDDIALAAYILNDYVNNCDSEIIYEHWAGQSDVLASIQNVLTLANKFLGAGLWQRVKSRISRF